MIAIKRQPLQRLKGEGIVYSSSNGGRKCGPKGLAVRQLKRYASWVQTVNKQAAFSGNTELQNRLISVKPYHSVSTCAMRAIPREVVDNRCMNHLSETQKACVAGFLDGDGSIYVKLTKNRTYRFGFQVAPYVVFYQAKKEAKGLDALHEEIGSGYIRVRKDGLVELIIGDQGSIRELLNAISPHLRLKRKQADLLLQILDEKASSKDPAQFVALCQRIDEFKELNYSKKRTVTAQSVRDNLRREGLLTP